MTRRTALLLGLLTLAGLLLAGTCILASMFAATAVAVAANCETEPSPACFGIESVGAALSTTQAGAHPDFSLDISAKLDPKSPENVFGLHNSYAAVRDARFNVPPGLIGDPNSIGPVQQCSVQQLVGYAGPGGGCPNGSQIGVSNVNAYELNLEFHEPVYMMQPPGGDIVARAGIIGGIFPIFIDFRVRSESDYGIVAEISNSPAAARVLKLESTLWGVPAAPAHNKERCTAIEAFNGCTTSPSRPPGSNEVPFFTNPTRCGVSLNVGVNASSWAEPEFMPEREVQTPFPEITGCNRVPFGPTMEAVPTSHHTSAPSGLDMTLKQPAAGGVKVLEPSQTRFIRIDFPKGLVVNTGAADGLAVCSPEQVGFEERVASHCPDASKLASTEFDIPVLERKLRGAIYLREPEPGKPYRVWVVADDLGLHVKFPGELELDKETGQVHSIIFGTPQTEGIPQAPLREAKLLFKSGFRAPLATPPECGTYLTHYEFTPWSGGPVAEGETPMQINEGCETGGFAPKLTAGSTNSTAGAFSPFTTTITRTDPEQNIAGLTLTLPQGLAASFAGIAHCEGAAAETGNCPPNSRIGKVAAAVGVGPAPLWVPQEGKRPTAVYLGGPYKGAPTSIVSVVPKQAGPFDFGDEVVRAAVFVNPVTAQATAKADPLPQIIEGTPLFYRAINVQLDRPNFALNPTSCARKEMVANLTSTGGKSASPTSSYAATDCAKLGFKPKIAFRLFGGTHRGAFPRLRATLNMPPGGANIGATSVILPHSEFIEQGHFRTICTRVQFAANECPAGSVYGRAIASTPLLDEPLEGLVYLRSTSEPDKYVLPDVVVALKGPPSLPVEIDVAGHVDSVHRRLPNGETVSLLRTTFNAVPDAPVSKFSIELQGGSKGLFTNSTNLCTSVNRATAQFKAQSGRSLTLHPPLQTSCAKHGKQRRGSRRLH
jgi:hypothetical protein